MPSHSEKRRLSYTPDQLFDLVADVEKYPEFLPWCMNARIRERRAQGFVADLVIGFKGIRERYTSEVSLDHEAMQIDVGYVDGPFKDLSNKWIFHPTEEGGCEIEFHVSFELKSGFLSRLVGTFFDEVVKRMVGAFEARARALYGGDD